MTDFSSMSDALLVVAIARWNEAALAEAYRRHGRTVQALARRVLGPDGGADDITQDVFIELWHRPERFDPGRGSLRTFLVTIAHSRAVDLLRSDRARSGREQRTAGERTVASHDVEDQIWDLVLTDRVKEAVGSLPDMERRVIELAYFGGHTYRQVAALLGEPEGTVKSRIRTGLRRLRAALIHEGVEPTWTGR
jgi:RNA polymerase sigma-70 factor (ECF subfamily)